MLMYYYLKKNLYYKFILKINILWDLLTDYWKNKYVFV